MKKFKFLLLSSCILGGVTFAQSSQAQEVGPIIQKGAYNATSRSFDVTVREASNGKAIKTVDVAVWSEENGQDDIKWYSSSAISQGQTSVRFNLANHSNRAGNYNTHAYVTFADGKKTGYVLENTKVDPTHPKITLGGGNVSLTSEVNAPSNGHLMTAIWSEENGQDDIKWYTTDGNGLASAPLANHKGYGTYQAHTYLHQNGKMTPVAIQSFLIDRPNISTQVVQVSDKIYDVMISNVPDYISTIWVPTWSDVNGQDDVKWYQAQKIGTNTYKQRIHLENHGYDFGHYSVHVYGENTLLGKKEGYAVTPGFQVSSISGLENPQVSFSSSGTNQFTVSVAETLMSKKVTALKLQVSSRTNAQLSQQFETKSVGYGKASIAVNLATLTNTADRFGLVATVLYSDNSSTNFPLSDQNFVPQVQTQVTSQPAKPRITAYINEANTYPVGQCTWGVKELAPWIPNWLGNATGWAVNARAKGFSIGNTPKVGSIVVWPNEAGGYGHVAYVTHVESATRIQVKEANYAGKQYIGNFRGWFNPLASYWGGSVSYIYPD